ncbi:MAG: hypothetical protein E6970_06745 [Peptostreptococcus sp.]|uniref:hypothetical protein n=1 Tax=Peptostreptococcus sp. TaxID=1262 RepID=UPI0028FF7AEB|nr:hypothetical protein [Peptostreptococcus sp.]MDU1265494.1 hypothetical protein [Peptostreptococcus sp.]
MITRLAMLDGFKNYENMKKELVEPLVNEVYEYILQTIRENGSFPLDTLNTLLCKMNVDDDFFDEVYDKIRKKLCDCKDVYILIAGIGIVESYNDNREVVARYDAYYTFNNKEEVAKRIHLFLNNHNYFTNDSDEKFDIVNTVNLYNYMTKVKGID